MSDGKALLRIIADEVNVKNIYINGRLVHSEPLLKDKYKEKQRQLDKIYGNERKYE